MRTVAFLFFIFFYSGAVGQDYSKLPVECQEKLSRIKSEKKRLKKYYKCLKKDTTKHSASKKERLKGLAKKEARNKKDEQLSNLPNEGKIDTTIVDKASDKATQVLNDSLRRYDVELPDVTMDSTQMDKVRQKGEAVARQEVSEHLGEELGAITLDSTSLGQVRSKGENMARQQIGEEIGEEFSNVKLDSTLTDQVKSGAKDRVMGMAEEELGEPIPEVRLDSAGRAELAQKMESRAEKELQNIEGFDRFGDEGELGKLDDYKSQLEQTREQLQQDLAKQELKEKMAAQAKEYISQNADKLQQVQSKMGELKKKYSYVPNSNDLSTARKRSSLEGEPLGKRLTYGGNFNVSETNPVSIDLSPVVGYRINKLFEVGVTGMYRAQFEGDKNGVNARGENVYGYSVFANHLVFRNFFGYIEGENISRVKVEQDQERRERDQTLLLGIGRKFNISKWLEMQAIISYNFLHNNQDNVYDGPIVFKTGVRIKK